MLIRTPKNWIRTIFCVMEIMTKNCVPRGLLHVGRGDSAGVRPVVARRQVPDRDIPAPAKASLFQ